MPTGIETCRRFIDLVQTFNLDESAYAQVLDPDFVSKELPNAVSPRGQSRGFSQCMAGMKRARELLRAQTYEVTSEFESGERVYLEMNWRGVIDKDVGPFRAGQTLTAYLCQAFELRGGRILSQRTYDCYEPFS